ncbi:MAG: tRNA threonylcarbamoyladenosine dehydratase [Clostridia bacterium]|nr:tRNA threonylcarbamoyladenosine dehydratase [Clostridia bacterium]
MREQDSRTYMMLGDEAAERLKNSHIILFGLGGVGSYTAEALARAGVGEITLVDGDKVAESNINRQLPALHSTVGRFKTDVVAERISDIDPDIVVNKFSIFYNSENCDEINFDGVTYVADAIDTVASKILLIERARAKNVPVISCMGAGNKLDPTKFEVAEIEKTSVCPLARVMRCELKKRGISGVKTVFSKEPPVQLMKKDNDEGRKKIPGSISFVPSVAGLIMAGEIIKDITGINLKMEE